MTRASVPGDQLFVLTPDGSDGSVDTAALKLVVRSGEEADTWRVGHLVTLDELGDTPKTYRVLLRSEASPFDPGSLSTQVLDALPFDFAIFDTDYRYLYVNPAAIPSPDVRAWIVGKNDAEYCHKRGFDVSIAERRTQWLRRAVTEHRAVSWDETLFTRDGVVRHHRRNVVPVVDSDGAVAFLVGYGQEITEQRHFEVHLRILESAMRRVGDVIIVTEGTVTEDVGPRIVFVNEAFTALFGWSPQDVVGRPLPIHAESGPDRTARASFREAIRSRYPVRGELLLQRKNGPDFWAEVSLTPIHDEIGSCTHWVAVLRDITAQKRLEALERGRTSALDFAGRGERDEALAALARVVQSWLPDVTGAVLLARDERLWYAAAPGLSAGYVRATDGAPISPSGGPSGASAYSKATIVVTDLRSHPLTARSEDEARRYGLRAVWVTPILDANQEIRGTFVWYRAQPWPALKADLRILRELAAFTSVVLERAESQTRLRQLAYEDALTGLPNRSAAMRRLEDLLSTRDRRGPRLAVGLLDLNRFKEVNDTFGHRAGDHLLTNVARRLKPSLPDDALLARMGGDEFLIVLPNVQDEREAVHTARQLTSALREPFMVEHQSVVVGGSIGLSLYPDHANSADTLLRRADAAMYRAKRRHLDVAVHEAHALESAGRLALESALHAALGRGEFDVVYQPYFSLSGAPVGAEALLRWHHPALGDVAPSVFVPVLEALGLIDKVGAWVLERACYDATQWPSGMRVAVNVSARQFEQHDLPDRVAAALERQGLSGSRLVIELTESLLMASPETASHMLASLKAIGVRIVMDDFGTGYSSLSYLRRFSLDGLKIDRSFLQGASSDATPKSRALVHGVAALGRSLGLEVTAEGVETSEQLSLARSAGCDLVQGYLWGRPQTQAALLSRFDGDEQR
ncbi:sensor domain-containing protein [Deinococcus yavapaiensis]|uniref:Diguanylate cyclase/phosphodiesterase with PAS/PAC sensor(S) n=1 Tax=Deinococcus yavapaiensis KR-236 TaxID=694435 RepID=A0A318SD03_9DEIO|nr:bifunctional diguanylate cyclase/phosphodiesterase [Deinococcus yavapaiensis]PYE54238.1 diguanylate cyclase/phosphodiesterase with PAS/PAC sensor(s) [Deinococcus yavapaiensis KR-236]